MGECPAFGEEPGAVPEAGVDVAGPAGQRLVHAGADLHPGVVVVQDHRDPAQEPRLQELPSDCATNPCQHLLSSADRGASGW